MTSIIFNCPHCDQSILIYPDELNCRIFRCGVYRHTYINIDPHMNKVNCDKLVKNNMIYGCSKPFLITDKMTIEKCDYI